MELNQVARPGMTAAAEDPREPLSLVLDYLLVASDTHRMLLSDDGRT